MLEYAIGVDLGGTNLRIAAVDERGALVEKVTLGTKVSLGRDHVIDEMCQAIEQVLRKYQTSSTLLGIGIGVPGIPMDTERNKSTSVGNLPGGVERNRKLAWTKLRGFGNKNAAASPFPSPLTP